MAKKASAPKAVAAKSAPKAAKMAAEVTTPVRNTAIPKAVAAKPAAAPMTISHDMIARRAYEISQSHECGSDHDNWCRAERELKGI